MMNTIKEMRHYETVKQYLDEHKDSAYTVMDIVYTKANTTLGIMSAIDKQLLEADGVVWFSEEDYDNLDKKNPLQCEWYDICKDGVILWMD